MTEDSIRQQLRNRGICVVIPTYNNRQTIARVIEDASRYCRDVIVVDDGCDDGTAAILSGIPGIDVVSYGRNRGKGYALRSGFKRALERGFAYAITMDADGQHYAHDIPSFLEANRRYPGALIVGSRRLEGVERSKGSEFANGMSNFWFRVQTGLRLEDTQTGYRLYPLKKLHGLRVLTSRYEAELELMVFASWHGVRIESVPVDVWYPPMAERVSHFRPVRDFSRIFLLNTILCFLALFYGLPLRLWRFLMVWVRTFYTLLVFFTLTIPASIGVWLYSIMSADERKKCTRIRNLIYRSIRFITLRHVFPGVDFTYDTEAADFSTPRVVICNHQSNLDLLCLLTLTPHIVFLTNDWVWNNSRYGQLVRNAGYLPVTEGLETMLPQLREVVEAGCSIAIFPEGTRSTTCNLGRFHQGAFFIAEQLHLDIQPLMVYGTGNVIPKGAKHLGRGLIRVKAFAPIRYDELETMGSLRERASKVRSFYRKEYEKLADELEQL